MTFFSSTNVRYFYCVTLRHALGPLRRSLREKIKSHIAYLCLIRLALDIRNTRSSCSGYAFGALCSPLKKCNLRRQHKKAKSLMYV